MKLIVITQYRENYGYRWKCKGGMQYSVKVESLDKLNELAEEITKEVEYKNEEASNEVIDWYVMGDSEEYPEYFYDVTHMEKVDGKWTRRREELVSY